MTRLRIAMIGQRGVPATFGGIERHVEELGARFAAAGHEVVVYCRPTYNEDRPARHRGMTLRYPPTVEARGLEAFVHSGVSSLATLGRGFDVVHFHALGPGLFSPIPAYLSHAAVVQTIHGLDDQRVKWGGAAQQLLRTGGWLSARVPEVTITVSRALRTHYREAHGRPALYVPNGAPTVRSVPAGATLARLGLRPGGYALFVGRLVPEKAPDLLLRAFREVPGDDVRLVLAGGSSHTDDYVDQLRALAAHDERVLLPGYVYGDDLAELYSNAGVFVQPSLLEGLPLTLLEAAAYGRSVVVSAIEPHQEVVGASGPGRRVVPVGDAAALAAAITETLTAPEPAAAGAAALSQEVLAHYDWDRAAGLTLRAYERAIALQRRTSAAAGRRGAPATARPVVPAQRTPGHEDLPVSRSRPV